MSADPAHTQPEMLAAIRGIVSRICDIPPENLAADQRIAYLDIDSVLAAEILVKIERDLDVDIDVRRIVDDWSGLTLSGLADQILEGSRD